MVSGRIIKLLVFELLEFVAFSTPTLVIMEQFASAYHSLTGTPGKTHYWLIVSCSIAYVASVTLLIWVPIKVLLYKKYRLYKKIKGWRPVMVMCVVFTTLPSFSFSIAVTEVKKNNGSASPLPETLPDLPVSLVLTSLIVVDIIEKLRIYPLRGQQKRNLFCIFFLNNMCFHSEDKKLFWHLALDVGNSTECLLLLLYVGTLRKLLLPGLETVLNLQSSSKAQIMHCIIYVDKEIWISIQTALSTKTGNEDRHIHTTTLHQIKTVTDQVKQKEENTSPPQPAWTTQASQPSATRTQISTPVLRVPQEPVFHSRVLRAMSQQDDRAQIFLWSFVLWSDTIEMVRVAGHPSVYKSGWLYPVYIFSFISILRIILTPQNPLLNFLSILLQDLPFIFVRLGLIITLGTVTPVLGLCKNVLVTFSYIYFNYLTKIWAFSTFETSSF